jgi:hypothetical protein
VNQSYALSAKCEWYVLYWRVTEKTVASRLPAALAYGLIRRGCSPADLATLAMLRPRGGHVPQQTKAGRAIKPGQGASNLAPPGLHRDQSRWLGVSTVG